MLSYKSKLLINFTTVFVVFSVIFIVFQQMRESNYRRNLLEMRLHSYAELVAASVERHGIENDSLEFEQIAHLMPDNLRLTVITRQGKVCYETDSTARSNNKTSHKSRPEVAQALKHTEGSDIRLSESTGQEYFYYAKSYGSFLVRVALPYDTNVQDYMKADNLFLWLVLFLFPVILFVLVRVSGKFGKSVALLRQFINSAERGLVDYDRISFPHSELGDIGQAILRKYKQQEDSVHLIAAERERLMRHFHYFEEGIAIFSAERQKLYANPRFMQYVNTILTHPTADINTIWNEAAFAPAKEFLDLQSDKPHSLAGEAPFFRFTLTAGSNHFALQLLIYNDHTFEMTLADITRAEKNRLLKQQMSNNITHELRTPVSSIRGYLETLTQCPNLADERKQLFIEKALAQTVRLTDLIRDVSLITKTEEAPDLMPREELNLSQIAEDTIEELRPQLAEEKMTVDNRLSSDLKLHGNYSLIYSVFRNLMENSIRYAGRETRLCLECYNENKEYCYFRYYDTGRGVPEEHLSRLFERFYRVSEGRTRECGGTGLGLSIVRNAIHFHNGTISVRNRQNGGLEFLFTLKK